MQEHQCSGTSSENAGFTEEHHGLVSIRIIKRSMQLQVEDPESIYNYYKKLIQLRKQEEVIVYGTFDGLEDADETYTFTQGLWVIKITGNL